MIFMKESDALRASMVSRRHLAQVGVRARFWEVICGWGERGARWGRKKSTLLAKLCRGHHCRSVPGRWPGPRRSFRKRARGRAYVNDLRQRWTTAFTRRSQNGVARTAAGKEDRTTDYVLKARAADHRKRFLVEVRVAEEAAQGDRSRVGTTKKRAEQEAAVERLKKLRKQGAAAEPLVEGNGS